MSRADFTCNKCEQTGKPKRTGFQYRLGINLAFSIISFGLWLFVWIPWLVIAKSFSKPKYQCRHCKAPIRHYPLGDHSCEHCNQMVHPKAGSFSRSYFNNILLTVISLGAWLWVWGPWFILGRRTKKCPACGGLFDSLEKPSFAKKAIASAWTRVVAALGLFGLPIWLSVGLLIQTQDVIDPSINTSNFELDIRLGDGYAVLNEIAYGFPTTNDYSDLNADWILIAGILALVIFSEITKQKWNRVLIGNWYYAWALLVVSLVTSALMSADTDETKLTVTRQAISQNQSFIWDQFQEACGNAGVEPPTGALELKTFRRDGGKGYSLERREVSSKNYEFSEYFNSPTNVNGYPLVCANSDTFESLAKALSGEKNKETICSWGIKKNYYEVDKPIEPGSRFTIKETKENIPSLRVECENLDSRILEKFYSGKFTLGS